LRTVDAADDRGLSAALAGRKAHPVRDIGNRVAVSVNLQLVQRLRARKARPW
jgi:hypothetical protein